MNVNAEPNNMIDTRIENSTSPALLIGQASELPIRVIENIRDNVEKHSDQIDGESLIEIEMAGHDPKYSTDESDCCRREIQLRKRLRQAKADSPIKENIDNYFELAQFFVKIIGVFPKDLSQCRSLADRNLQRFEETSDDNWRQRARVNIGVRVKPQVLERLLRSGDKSAKRAERLRKGAVDERDAVLHFELFSGAATVFATAENRMRFVNENTCAMRLGDVGQLG